MPTIAQSAGRALILLLQEDTIGALRELNHHKLDLIGGEPVLIEHNAPECYLSDCTDDADCEGWARKIDPFTGQPSGMLLFIPVCPDHRHILIGAQGEG